MLDKLHPTLPQPKNDQNVYTLGELHGHNVVIACLPSGVYGTWSASIVAVQMLNTFPAIRFSLLVGIGGGVPSNGLDIRLGDVVVSKPTNIYGGVVQYDYGKTIGTGRFQRTGSSNKPPSILLAGISRLEADHFIGSSQIPAYLAQMTARYPATERVSRPGSEYDILFDAGYRHHNPQDRDCRQCDPDRRVQRSPRSSHSPLIHYGLIASGSQVMRDGLVRDQISRELGGSVMCFEMEAAGLMDNFPCLVIRGICDYADSHKNKSWQPYAAAVASAYAKELLSVIPVIQLSETPEALTYVRDQYAIDAPESEGEEEAAKSGCVQMKVRLIDPVYRRMILGRAGIPHQHSQFLCPECLLICPEAHWIAPRWICCECEDGPKVLSHKAECEQCHHQLCYKG
ncbi:nucleoside phosphorylase domain-containing protein [Aspergillus fruticulosus]